MKYALTKETAGDAAEIEALMDLAFGPGRHSRNVVRFRDQRAPMPQFCFVAKKSKEMVASIRFWPVCLPDGQVVPLLGPLAVRPELRGLGIGRGLVRKGMDAVRQSGAPALLIIGDPGYYAPFGFRVEPVRELDMGGPVVPLALMGIEYEDGSLSRQSGTITPVPIK